MGWERLPRFLCSQGQKKINKKKLKDKIFCITIRYFSIHSAVHARKTLVQVSLRKYTRVCMSELLLLIWDCTCDPRFVHPKYRASCCRSMSNVPFRIKQDKAEIRKQKETVTSFAILKTKLHLASIIVQLIMMLARDIFCSYWGFCTRVETLKCDRTCLRAWITQ